MILFGLLSGCVLSMKQHALVVAACRPTISASCTSVCSPSASLCSKTLAPPWYPTSPSPVCLILFFSDSEPSEYTSKCLRCSSSSVTSSMWALAHSSFTDVPMQFPGVKIFTLSRRSSSDSHHGGSVSGAIVSVSCIILLLMRVMQVVNLVFWLILYLFDSLNWGSGVWEVRGLCLHC